MNIKRKLDTLIAKHRPVFIECSKRLSEKEAWSPVDCPVIVIDNRKPSSSAEICAIGSLASIVPASSAIDKPEIKEWLRLARANGHEEAFSEMLTRRGEDIGCRFAESYGLFQAEQYAGVKSLWSTNDLSHFVMKTRESFPNAIGCVALFIGEDGKNYGVVTFEAEVEIYLD